MSNANGILSRYVAYNCERLATVHVYGSNGRDIVLHDVTSTSRHLLILAIYVER